MMIAKAPFFKENQAISMIVFYGTAALSQAVKSPGIHKTLYNILL